MIKVLPHLVRPGTKGIAQCGCRVRRLARAPKSPVISPDHYQARHPCYFKAVELCNDSRNCYLALEERR